MSLSAPPGSGRSRVVAVLGPTNTGKTHLAMERMLGHPSGMIGFPLRLLARENYDRAVAVKGAAQVALITGEEKIVPPRACYFLCTVESMPLDRAVAFLAVDEIQMAADPDRGHLFTDRLLHARGGVETMFMGAETIRPLLRRLIPEAEHESRPRFSTLLYTGPRKLSRLPPRSAVVAFSLADVYALAELVRRQRGGTALVLGALSPRTRNAQVAMYQAGEVDYLVATDAIGMGLNMHVDHVAFAASRKFDGRHPRALTPAEMAQIGGRAGRYTRDGTFGTTAERGPLDEEIVDRIENHRFDALKTLFWRNSELSFASLPALRASLALLPDRPGLVRAREADDELALAALGLEADIAASARSHAAVRLLWEVCQIPDFGKVTGEGHARLLGQIYRSLAGLSGTRQGRIPADWIARQVERLDRVDGDIEALTQRIAGIRTWTYVSHRPDWLDDASGWQERTRGIEDKLSDALHERLIQRFVDRRTASLVGRMRQSGALIAAVTTEGGVVLEGHRLGRLEGFRFLADAPESDRAEATASRAVTAAALRALAGEIEERVRRLESDDDEAFALSDDGRLLWRDAAVGRLIAGPDVLRPQIEPLASDLLGGGQRERIRVRLLRWLNRHLRARLAPLFLAESAAAATAARGLLFQLAEALGSLPRARAAAQILAITDPERRRLAAAGLRFGASAIYFPVLLKPSAVVLRAILWCTAAGVAPMPPPPPGRTSVPVQVGRPGEFYEACGFRVVGPRAVRIDVVERVLGVAHKMLAAEPAPTLMPLASLLGCPPAEVTALLAALGFSAEESEGGVRLRINANTGSRSGKRRRKPVPGLAAPADSPFAKLRALCGSR